MPGYFTDIDKKSEGNDNYCEVLYTGPNSQLVLMSLEPGEDTGMEVHGGSDQFIRVEEGQGSAIMDGKEFRLEAGSAVAAPAGSQLNLINTSKTSSMKIYLVYSPPYFPDGVIHKTKTDALTSHSSGE
jgi:mannose-6-phosphate isomerase-like protein (cupin superfamily)